MGRTAAGFGIQLEHKILIKQPFCNIYICGKTYVDIILQILFNLLLSKLNLMNIWPFVLNLNKRLKNGHLFIQGITTKSSNLYKNSFAKSIFKRHFWRSGTRGLNSRIDLILFYLEFKKRWSGDIPDNILFMALKSKALHLGRTQLREMQSGSLIESLDNLLEDEGFEHKSDFTLSDLENFYLSVMQWNFYLQKNENLYSFYWMAKQQERLKD